MTSEGRSWMAREIAEIPGVARQLCEPEAQADFGNTGDWIRDLNPTSIVTIARGSSDHAATCLKYAIELVAGLPVASIGPSIASIYDAPLRLDNVLALAISQSGGSEDLLSLTHAVQSAGGHTLTLTNTKHSPLAAASPHYLDIAAGTEHAVAATKSYTNSILSGLWVLAHWRNDTGLGDALRALPAQLDQAMTVDIAPLAAEFSSLDRLVVLARGPNLGIAKEIALKAMEVCAIPATAYSSAEVLHGPSAILKDGYPVLAIGGTKHNGMADTLEKLKRQGARVLPPIPNDPSHVAIPALDSLVPVYRAMEAASRTKGMNPDKPENLRKVTNTV
jgi:glucosamine--fructose-6-phosphate aminotransferase (isomerizing)